MGASDMSLQLVFDYRFTGSIKDAWKGNALNQIHTLLALVHNNHTLLPLTFWNYVPQTQTSYQVNKLARWGTGELSTVTERSRKTVRNVTTKHNPVTLPINRYAVGPPDFQLLDFTKLGYHQSVQHMPQKDVTEFLYTSNQIVCVKDDKGDSEITLVVACQQEEAKVGIEKW